MVKTLCFLITFFFNSSISYAVESVYSPNYGVICDRLSGFCADHEGISFGLSESYLGKTKAYAKFKQNVDSIGLEHFVTRRYTLINGVKCDHDREVCKKSNGKVEAAITDILFGE